MGWPPILVGTTEMDVPSGGWNRHSEGAKNAEGMFK
jgi:hypothetical protein